MTITPIAIPAIPQSGPITPPKAAEPSGSFEGVLGQAVQNLATQQSQADQQAVGMATGQDVSLVDTMLSMEQTSLDFKLAMQVRDKVIGAYQDVMRTQV